MRRREFITLLGGAAAWPLAVRAQQRERMRRIGVLMNLAADDAVRKPVTRRSCRGCSNWVGPSAVTCGSTSLGRRRGRAHSQRCRRIGRARARRHPGNRQRDRGLATGDPHRADRVPVVTDPVGAGFVDSLARPGGNTTGFTRSNSIGAKWLELLKQIAPGVKRAAVLRDPAITARHRPVGRNPGRGAVARGRGHPDQRARPRRDRARCRGIRPLRTAA